MKYIYNYVEHSLNESFNSKEAKKQFLDKGLISKKDFTIIKKAFLPKCVYWGCREKVRAENTDVILDSIYDITIWFEKNKQYLKSKDIYIYAYEELRLLMNDPSIGPKKKKVKGQGKYKILYEDKEGNKLVHVKDHAASVYWAHKYRQGEITDGQWCTAAYSGDTMFKKYLIHGPILIYILPNEKGAHQRLCSVSVDGRGNEYGPALYNIKEINGGKTYTEKNENVILRRYFDSSDKENYEFPLSSKSAKKMLNIDLDFTETSSSSMLDLSYIKSSDFKTFHLMSLFLFHEYYTNLLSSIFLTDIVDFTNKNITFFNTTNYNNDKLYYQYLYKIKPFEKSKRLLYLSSTFKLSEPKLRLYLDDVVELSTNHMIDYSAKSKECNKREIHDYFSDKHLIDYFDKSFIKKYNFRNIDDEYCILDVKNIKDIKFYYSSEHGYEDGTISSKSITDINIDKSERVYFLAKKIEEHYDTCMYFTEEEDFGKINVLFISANETFAFNLQKIYPGGGHLNIGISKHFQTPEHLSMSGMIKPSDVYIRTNFSTSKELIDAYTEQIEKTSNI